MNSWVIRTRRGDKTGRGTGVALLGAAMLSFCLVSGAGVAQADTRPTAASISDVSGMAHLDLPRWSVLKTHAWD